MVGGTIKRDDGFSSISSTNIFSALESRRRKSNKKRSDKDKTDSKSKSTQPQEKLSSPPVVWTPTPVNVTSWADCEEDDDDFFALPALPPIADQHAPTVQTDLRDDFSQDESDGEDEIDEDVDEEIEEQEAEGSYEDINVTAPKPPALTPASREPDRQLSKKELKKKELAELDAVLAELGLNPKDEKDSAAEGVKEVEENGVESSPIENLGSGSAATESKSTKRRKAKKEKPLKEQKEEENGAGAEAGPKEETEVSGENTETDSTPVDRKEVLKKIASMKKKKSFKDSDSAAKAAAAEAAARAAKLAAAKKKEKNHYNQQPVR